MNAKAEELFKSKEFFEKIYPMSFEEVQAEIEANGGEITIEELKEIAEETGKILKKMEENGGELSEAELEAIAGGKSKIVKTAAYCLAGSYIGFKVGSVGGVPGSIVGAFAGSFIGGYLSTK